MTDLIVSADEFAEFFFDPDSDGPIDVPDGEWEFMLFSRFIRDGDERPRARAAVSITDLIGLVVEGYDDVDDDGEALIARYFAARDIAGEVQAMFNAIALRAGVDLTGPDSDVLRVDKSEPLPVGEWDGLAPLVLVRTDYAPFTDLVTPTGGIVWIDPTDERSFVESMDTAKFTQFSVRTGG